MQASRRDLFRSAAALAAVREAPASIEVPKMKFFGADVSRLVAGVNPFQGYSHFNGVLSAVMREWYTSERVCEVLHQCCRYGINAFNHVEIARAPEDWERFQSQGGKMHLIMQGMGDPEATVRKLKPLALYRQGEFTDRAYNAGDMTPIREWCKRARQTGVVVGVGTHRPEVITLIEEQNWDVDFYAGCVYNRTRRPEEWARLLNGQVPEMPSEIYLQSDPPNMYRVMRQTRKPCFAFKIMAAGRIGDKGAEQAFQTAYASIKPTDGVIIGLFPRIKDEVKENAERVARLLRQST